MDILIVLICFSLYGQMKTATVLEKGKLLFKLARVLVDSIRVLEKVSLTRFLL